MLSVHQLQEVEDGMPPAPQGDEMSDTSYTPPIKYYCKECKSITAVHGANTTTHKCVFCGNTDAIAINVYIPQLEAANAALAKENRQLNAYRDAFETRASIETVRILWDANLKMQETK